MYRAKFVVAAALVAWSVSILAQAPAGVIAFEGARVIVGDGRAPIENATFIVTGNRFTAVGRAGDVRVPAGATRVNLAGKTVMPGILDTHNHLSQTREMLIDDLKRRAYYGVTAAQSMGQDTTNVSFQIREETREGKIPGALLHRWTRPHRSGAGTHDGAPLGGDGRRGPRGGEGGSRQESGSGQVLG